MRQLWACDVWDEARAFAENNRRPDEVHGSVDESPLPEEAVMIYAVGPPGQGAARPWGRMGPRAARFDQSIQLIVKNRPLAFILEESDKVPNYQQGRWWQRGVEELAAHGYRVHWAIYNDSKHGVPQNRPRLWAVGIRKDTPGAGEGFRGLEPLPAGLCLALADILEPKEESDTAERLPSGQVAAMNVKKARDEAGSRGLTVDWMVTQHVGQGWNESVRPRPRLPMPCLLHSNKGGYWVGSRGRAARVSDHSRAQGLPNIGMRWP